MISGIGTDIVRIARMQAALGRRGDALAQRLLAPVELPAFSGHPDPARFLAKRFAIKEAVLKALGTGLRGGMRWHDISVDHDHLGKPLLALRGEAGRRLGVRRCHLSVSDEQDYALAFVIIESES
ncbi:MAG: holo-ACP synthase [Alcanivoracaceae bacterium]|jgi:holo-[acyl-carrier protein] synthase|nr:holo-ACP synthase [Alcanivoracaceae bacterium]